jgi:hypothetical protein
MNCIRIAEGKVMRRCVLAFCIGAAATILWAVLGTSRIHAAGSEHVRWDLINVDFSTTPVTITPGGTSFADADVTNRITFTDSSGTFVAPASGGTSGAVTGGGKWETFDGISTKSGTYTVIGLVSWQFASFQPQAGAIDLIDPDDPRANGNAILRIRYDDGSEGILGVGCHDGAAPPGIQEGVIATKGYLTYWTGAFHAPGAVINFTTFHILK